MTTTQLTQPEKTQTAAPELEQARSTRVFVPRTDIFENENEIVLLAEMPGVDENTLDITLDKDILTLSGRVSMPAPEGCRLTYAEYRTGDYERSFRLSDLIDRDSISATIKNGVLRLVLPKGAGSRVKKITVQPA